MNVINVGTIRLRGRKPVICLEPTKFHSSRIQVFRKLLRQTTLQFAEWLQLPVEIIARVESSNEDLNPEKDRVLITALLARDAEDGGGFLGSSRHALETLLCNDETLARTLARRLRWNRPTEPLAALTRGAATLASSDFLELRKRLAGARQEDFARLLGITQPYVSLMETGRRPVTAAVCERLRTLLLSTVKARNLGETTSAPPARAGTIAGRAPQRSYGIYPSNLPEDHGSGRRN